MLTPKQLRQLGDIVSQETQSEIPGEKAYFQAALLSKPFPIGENLRISGNGRLEASRPSGPKAYPNRLATREIIRIVTRSALAGIPVGNATKEWIQSALRASDFRQEAENCLAKRR